MAVLCKVNFPLVSHTPPALIEVNFGLSVYAPVLDGDDFALVIYTPPSLSQVNFAFVAGITYDEIGKEQVILLVLGQQDNVIFSDTEKLQIILSLSGLLERAVLNEKELLELILVLQGISDTYIPIGRRVFPMPANLRRF